MKILFINWLTSDTMMQALCWTLLHSLWQGLVLAIIAAFIITVTRRSSPELRYNLLTGLFILFIAATGFTFMQEVSGAQKSETEKNWVTPSTEPGSKTANIYDNTITSATDQPGYFERMVQYFNEHASLIVVIWFILFSAKLVRMLSNIGYVQRIRHYKVTDPAVYWRQRLIELASDLQMKRPILLLESAIIKVPMVAGLLKPVILIPLGLLANLPHDQVEAVLLHELAHIRRKDYLVNLLQSLAEVVFFFNPAILWISSLMREERESCCDDVAIGRIKNKKQFIHALVAFQEYAMHKSNKSTAIAFAGRKNYLLNRVRRIIYNENKKLNAMEKGFFIFSIVAIGLVSFVSVKQSPVQIKQLVTDALPVTKVLDVVPAVPQTEPADTIPEPDEFTNLSYVINNDDGETRTITAADKNGKRYKIVNRDDVPKELYVNDKKIPAGEMDRYKKLIAAMEQAVAIRQKKDMEKMTKDQQEQSAKMMQLDAERLQLIQKLGALDNEKAKLNFENRKEFKDHEWENAAKLNLFNEQLLKMHREKLSDELFNESNSNNEELLQQKINLNVDNILQKQLLNEKLQTLQLDQKLQNKNNQVFQKQLLNEKLNLLHNDAWEQQQQRTYSLTDPIIQDIVEEKIIPQHQEEMSFELNDRSFIVNGKK